MRYGVALLSLAMILPFTAAHAADGLVPPDTQDLWPQWQARITVSSSRLTPVSLTGALDASAQPSTPLIGALVGDYYFDAPGLRLPQSVGGLRATGGLMAGVRGLSRGLAPPARFTSRFGVSFGSSISTTADAAPDTLPYLGLGYTGLSAKGGWGITADLGLVAASIAGTGQPSHSVFGIQSLDSALTNLRLSPVIQLGVSYSF